MRHTCHKRFWENFDDSLNDASPVWMGGVIFMSEDGYHD